MVYNITEREVWNNRDDMDDDLGSNRCGETENWENDIS